MAEPHNASSYPHSTLAPSYNSDDPNCSPYSTFSSTSYNDDPNHSPYNTFSSFKQIAVDNTVVSAYEVGIANGIGAHPRNNLAAKNGQSVRKGEVPMPRERRSLARKPPSGAKLEYKTLGSISKSKSLSEINIINNRGNKILDSHAKRFDNSPLSHNKNTSKGFKHTVNNGDSCSITNYQNEGVNKTIISVDNRNGQNVADTGQIDSFDDKDKLEHQRTDKGSGNLQVYETESDRLLLFSKENGLNERKSGFNRRHSLQDGIGLQSSNLSKVDSSDIHRYRVAQGEKGKRYSKRRHLSLQNPPTTTKVTNENSESARQEHRAPDLTENESEALQSGNHSASSRRKLPKVPAKATVLPKHMSDVGEFIISEPIDAGQIGQTQKSPQLSEKSSIGSTKMDRDQLHSNVDPNMDMSSGTANNQSHKHAKTSHSGVEANYLKSQQGQLKTKVVSKMADYEINSSDTKSIPKSLPSHKVSVTQGLVKGEKVGEINAQYDETAEQTIDRANPKVGNANSGGIEDKFRKKLELLAKASHKKSKSSRHKHVSNKSDVKSNSAESTEVNSATICASKGNERNEQNFPSPANKNSAKVGSEAGGCEKSISENECESKRNQPVNINEGELASNTVFNFNQEVIQELTDLVMTRPEQSRPDSEVTDYSDITETSVSENKEIPSTASDISTYVSSDKSVDPRSIESEDSESRVVENHSQKLELEGRSFDGKDQGDESKETNHSAKTNTADIIVKGQAENQNKQSSQKQTHVLRTPSYRKRVMARAKLRYGKKSQNFKECSCVRSDNGDIEKCDFCKIYEMKQRSRTSLGLGEISDTECSEIASPRRALTPELTGRSIGHAQNSPRSVRKVNVSPRVDVLLSSNLFKKHLQKHENLIHKHTMSYKRFGMQKSVSNLDLSEGFTTDTDQSYKDTASEISEPAQVSDFADDASERSYNVNDIPDESSTKPTNRRHSLTGDTTLTFNEYDTKSVMKKKSGDTLPTSFARPRSRPGIGGLFDNVRTKSQNRNYIPSFNEFRRQKGKDPSSSDNKNNEVGDSVDSLDSGSTNTIEGSDNTCTSSVETIVEHNLHTVLEADERGSRENLLQSNAAENVTQNIPQKHDIVKPEVIVTPANPSQTETIQHRPRPKLKGKSRTLPNIDLSVLSDNSSDRSCDTSIRDKRRINAKRPRSVISKKSSGQDSDTPDTSDNSQIAQQNVSARPKLKGHGKRILRSESDTKYETEKGKPDDHESMKSKGVHSRHLSLLEKGHNTVTFNLDIPNNDSSSERSSSAAGSYQSDSLYSESCVNETITATYDGENVVNSSGCELLATNKDDTATSVLRSTSDACEITQEAARKRRERKERPYKSDPFSGTEIIPATKRCAIREERAKLREHLSFASSSREEILSFLDGVSQSDLEHGESFPSLEELSEDEQKSNNETEDNKGKLGKHPSNVSSLSTDSGVIGQEESSPTNTLTHSMSEQRANWYQTRNGAKKSFSASCSNLYDIKNHGCHDCNNDGFHHKQTIYVCTQCEQRRIERKKIIQEVIDTEVNYGRDLVILQDEFYKPMLKAGLLTKDQLDCIFLNLDELIHVNKHFITKLKAAINHSNQHDDEDLQEVMIGSLFLESSTMFLTFENYCVNQAQAPILLEQLEREKELLRIFLHVSQSDNHLLRRMHLKSFLMVPVQRIMKYPLLLDRLYKVTIDKHRDKEALREAKEKIEDILGHINAKSKSSSIKQRKGSEKHYSVTEKIEVSRVALETLGWNRKDVCDVITTRLQITQPLDHMWAVKKCKNHKFMTVHGVLLSLIQPSYIGRENEPVSGSAITNSTINNNNNNYNNNNNNNNKKNTVNNNFTNSLNNGIHIQSAAVVLIKEKNGRYQVAREPFMLEKCVVSQDPDYMDVFELLEWNRESYLIKAETPTETKTWVQHLRRQMQDLGYWRKRRNALPNILLNHLS